MQPGTRKTKWNRLNCPLWKFRRFHNRFVRREKEISETKCELSQSESIRFQQRCEYLEGQIEELQKNIAEQRTQSEVDTQTAAQHAEIMEKVEKLNELTEANKILANEKSSVEETVRELVTKVQSNSCFTTTARHSLGRIKKVTKS